MKIDLQVRSKNGLFDLVQSNKRGLVPRMIYSLSSLLEIRFFGIVDIDELLRIAIDQRKPAALYLNHEPVPFPERMEYVGHPIFDLCDLPWDERFGTCEAVAEFSSEQLSTNQLLKSAHPSTSRAEIVL